MRREPCVHPASGPRPQRGRGHLWPSRLTWPLLALSGLYWLSRFRLGFKLPRVSYVYGAHSALPHASRLTRAVLVRARWAARFQVSASAAVHDGAAAAGVDP